MKKRILLLAEDTDTLTRWNEITGISLDYCVVDSFQTTDKWFSSEIKNYSIAFLVSEGVNPPTTGVDSNNTLKDKLPIFKELRIPVIVNRAFAKNYSTVAELIRDGILAIVEDDMSIIQISQVFNIVMDGGIHIDPKQLIKV